MLQIALQSCSVKWVKGTSGETATTAMVERLEVQDLTLGSAEMGGEGKGGQEGGGKCGGADRGSRYIAQHSTTVCTPRTPTHSHLPGPAAEEESLE